MNKRKIITLCSVLLLWLLCVSGCGGPAEAEDHAPKPADNGATEEREDAEAEFAQSPEAEVSHESEHSAEEDLPMETEKEDGFSGPLSVSGTKLTDADGNPVQLKGISTHGMAWYPEYVNEACFRQLKEEWGINVIRLAMYTAESGGYCTDGDRDRLKNLIRDGVKYATDCGLYVIIDWHILSDGNPNRYLEEAEDFFGEMAEDFADYDNVLYEICNEPNGGTSWSEVKNYAEQIIGTIREKDSSGVILVGTPDWCQRVEDAAADPITGYDNIMYTLHFYAATHTDSLRQSMVRATEAGLPVFVSEYGICDASGNGAADRTQADAWMELLNTYDISCVAWNLSNKAETSAILKSSCNKTEGFAEEDLSDSGQWLYKMLRTSRGETGASGQNGASEYDGTSGQTETSGQNGTSEQAGTSGQNGASVQAGTSEQNGTSGQAGTSEQNGTSEYDETSGESDTPPAEQSPAEPPEEESASLSVTAEPVNSWEENGETCYQYSLTVSNPAETERNGWTIRLSFSESFTLKDSWNGVYRTEGNDLIISSMDYNGYIAGNGSVDNVGFIVQGGDRLTFR